MKILQVLPELNSGGVERGTIEIADYLVKSGDEALVVSNGGRQVAALEKVGARHIALPVHKKSLSSLLQVGRLRRILEIEKPDILHIRSRVPAWIAHLAWRNMDPVTRPRLVTTVHGFYSVNRYSAIMTKGERVIAVSESVREYILKNYPATPAGKITVIHRGIQPEMYPPDYQPAAEWLSRWRAENPELEGKSIFLLPGRITRLKGHADYFELIHALKAEGRPVHGLIAGDTHPKKKAYLGELRKKVAEMGLENDITFLGHRSDVREIMAVSDIVCALSQQPESFGRTVLEAMALGKPVIGYNCGGVGELLDHIFPAGKIPLGDATELLRTAKTILGSELKPHLPKGDFTLQSMCSATLSLYEELLQSPR